MSATKRIKMDKLRDRVEKAYSETVINDHVLDDAFMTSEESSEFVIELLRKSRCVIKQCDGLIEVIKNRTKYPPCVNLSMFEANNMNQALQQMSQTIGSYIYHIDKRALAAKPYSSGDDKSDNETETNTPLERSDKAVEKVDSNASTVVLSSEIDNNGIEIFELDDLSGEPTGVLADD